MIYRVTLQVRGVHDGRVSSAVDAKVFVLATSRAEAGARASMRARRQSYHVEGVKDVEPFQATS